MAAEVSGLLDTDITGLMRYEPDGAATILAIRSDIAPTTLVGTRVPAESESATASMLRAGLPVRLEDRHRFCRLRGRSRGARDRFLLRGRSADHRRGPASGVACSAAWTGGRAPWPMPTAGWRGSRSSSRPPSQTPRAAPNYAFASRNRRRCGGVATLVARGVSADELFEAVAEEVGLQLGADATWLLRFEGTDAATILAGQGEHGDRPPVGSRVTLEGENVTAMVLRTGQTARLENFDQRFRIDRRKLPADSECARQSARRSSSKAAVGAWRSLRGAGQSCRRGDVEERMLASSPSSSRPRSRTHESRGELAASRARVVTAAAQERQRMVRDLHDGAQQRLVHTVITLKLALRELDAGERHVEEYVTEALDHARAGQLRAA